MQCKLPRQDDPPPVKYFRYVVQGLGWDPGDFTMLAGAQNERFELGGINWAWKSDIFSRSLSGLCVWKASMHSRRQTKRRMTLMFHGKLPSGQNVTAFHFEGSFTLHSDEQVQQHWLPQLATHVDQGNTSCVIEYKQFQTLVKAWGEWVDGWGTTKPAVRTIAAPDPPSIDGQTVDLFQSIMNTFQSSGSGKCAKSMDEAQLRSCLTKMQNESQAYKEVEKLVAQARPHQVATKKRKQTSHSLTQTIKQLIQSEAAVVECKTQLGSIAGAVGLRVPKRLKLAQFSNQLQQHCQTMHTDLKDCKAELVQAQQQVQQANEAEKKAKELQTNPELVQAALALLGQKRATGGSLKRKRQEEGLPQELGQLRRTRAIEKEQLKKIQGFIALVNKRCSLKLTGINKQQLLTHSYLDCLEALEGKIISTKQQVDKQVDKLKAETVRHTKASKQHSADIKSLNTKVASLNAACAKLEKKCETATMAEAKATQQLANATQAQNQADVQLAKQVQQAKSMAMKLHHVETELTKVRDTVAKPYTKAAQNLDVLTETKVELSRLTSHQPDVGDMEQLSAHSIKLEDANRRKACLEQHIIPQNCQKLFNRLNCFFPK